jgi:hypothetical protein
VATELRAQQSKPAATPEEARAANAALREAMRERGNCFEVIEREAADTLRTVGYSGGALSQGMLVSVVSHHGFAIRYVQDLPRSVRSLTDLRNRRIYVKQEPVGPIRRARSSCRRSATSCSATRCRATSPTSCGSGWR